MKFETLAVHAGARIDPETGAVAPPIHLSTTFARDAESRLIGESGYIRDGNPTQARLEEALAALEGGAAALAFGSGVAAGAALLESLEPGSRVLFPDDVYHGFRAAALEFLPRWGHRAEFVAMDELSAVGRALEGGASLLWTESPSNPLMKITDLAAAAKLAREAGALVAVDNTFATAALQRPLAAGADVVIHSTTKYIGGHTDVQGGALVFRERGPAFERAMRARSYLGAVASPFNSWLALRGLRTLPLRMERHSANALAIARRLESHPGVSAVHYPGLASHPGHGIAARQMAAFGGMLSFRVRAGREAALAAVSRVRLFVRATSLGGVESLIEHRRTSEGAHSTTPADLLRISVGLEHADDLIADLEQALG